MVRSDEGHICIEFMLSDPLDSETVKRLFKRDVWMETRKSEHVSAPDETEKERCVGFCGSVVRSLIRRVDTLGGRESVERERVYVSIGIVS